MDGTYGSSWDEGNEDLWDQKYEEWTQSDWERWLKNQEATHERN